MPALNGQGVLVTRPAGQQEALVAALTDAGATVLSFPVIEIVPRARAVIETEAGTLDAPDLSIFVSANAVEYGSEFAAGRIAAGLSSNLLERAADVMLKERRKLIIVPRETPYSDIHLENMLRLSRMGAVMLCANPGFYNRAEAIDDLIDFIVAKILDQLQVSHELMSPWGE